MNAEEVVAKLKSCDTAVELFRVDSIPVEGMLDSDYVTFYYRIDPFKKILRAQAMQILDTLQNHFNALIENAEFSAYVGKRKLKAVLYVFSGQMDFEVVTKEGDALIWNYTLQ